MVITEENKPETYLGFRVLFCQNKMKQNKNPKSGLQPKTTPNPQTQNNRKRTAKSAQLLRRAPFPMSTQICP